jgi:hypothetical protein
MRLAKDIQLLFVIESRGEYFQFGLVFTKKKKSNQFIYLFLNQNQNQFKPTSFGSVRLIEKKNWKKPISS